MILGNAKLHPPLLLIAVVRPTLSVWKLNVAPSCPPICDRDTAVATAAQTGSDVMLSRQGLTAVSRPAQLNSTKTSNDVRTQPPSSSIGAMPWQSTRHRKLGSL
ncbi:hypothetical protein BD311DRAFT_454718 [Dichomitus squalens]|uniref:Secreted protein n=1 Tax=Dichomitus squalens TaxID=114155 RepID=A0A4Q9MFT8_9APHY|nr:hypothetical protein BD311DRAFT_454718 [Dichomitus squalens]